MKTISVIVLGTANRTQYLDECINSLNGDYFDQKILSIDQFGGHKFSEESIKKYSDMGWTVLIENYKSKLYSIINACNAVTSDYIFFQEDDISIDKLPDKQFILDLLNMNVNNRDCGFISLDLGGAKTEITEGILADLVDCETNTLSKADTYFAFMRDESQRNEWFISFPSIYIDKHIFLDCLNYLSKNNLTNNCDIEFNLTAHWFNLEYDKDYFKACISKNNLKEFLNKPIKHTHELAVNCSLINILDISKDHFTAYREMAAK